MNSTLYTAVLVGLTLVLVAMFGFGFYWLATKDRPAQPTTPTPSTSPASVPVDEFDEWEAYAPYPDHIVHAAQDASAESGDSYPPFGRREAFAYASPGTEARHDLHDAIESVTSAAPRAARPVPLSMGQLMTTSWTITTVSRAATHSVPHSAQRLASPSRLSPSIPFPSGARRAVCPRLFTRSNHASRSNNGLRRIRTLPRSRPKGRPETTARSLGSRRRHGLAHRRSRSSTLLPSNASSASPSPRGTRSWSGPRRCPNAR